ncbi:hypothetical protein C7450_101404 [Chelatococcus asaccharovorans]|uniref:Uncharacterized protein n=1 Tax=Chelatococcus asaccharovorans TaxID=28210 RepID=A0A2V3UH05_9HYPH|nr:hypothetical protein C7450_101404 [Chelatococcus asaccharovorans]
MAGRTGHMKDSATIALADAMDERASCRRAVKGKKAERDLRIAVPENASVPALRARAARPSSRIEILKTVERQQANAHRGLGSLLRRWRVSVRTNEIAMGCAYVFHHPPEGLYILYIDLALPPLRVNDDPPSVVGVMSRFDQNVDLSLDTCNAPPNRSVRSHAKLRRKLVRHQSSDQALVEFPVFPHVLHRDRPPKTHTTAQRQACYTIRSAGGYFGESGRIRR